MRLAPDVARLTLAGILLSRGCPAGKAQVIAREMVRNSLEGTYSHGIQRFPLLVRMLDEGSIRPQAEPVKLFAFGGFERWDGGSGLGIPNALFSMGQAMELARVHGLGCVAMRNTNHWLRAATYGYQACEAGMAGICFTNTMPNMPAWGAEDPRLGNNPIVFAFPWKEGAVLVDTAMSQFSYGALETAMLEGRRLSVPGGFDSSGRLTDDPIAVFESRRPVPMGFWKGSALSFALDIFAAGLSQGNSVSAIGSFQGGERDLSQVFIALDLGSIAPRESTDAIVGAAVEYLLASKPDGSGHPVVYPGQRMKAVRARNEAEGIPVDGRVWEKILALRTMDASGEPPASSPPAEEKPS